MGKNAKERERERNRFVNPGTHFRGDFDCLYIRRRSIILLVAYLPVT